MATSEKYGSTALRKALVITLVSLTLWTAWNFAREDCHPYRDLSCGFFTDHFAHMNMSRLFAEKGVAIYTNARGDLVQPLTPDQVAALPADLQGTPSYGFPGWPQDKPFTSTWTHVPNVYPPGDLILFAPFAMLYSFTGISFSTLNLLLIQYLIILAHVSLFFVFRSSFDDAQRGWIGVLGLYFIYTEVMHWTLEGFYDGAWIAPLLLTPLFIARRQHLPALLTVSLALFMHYRALFYLPWAALALYRLVKDREWESWKNSQMLWAGVAGLMATMSLRVFLNIRGVFTGATGGPVNPIGLGAGDLNLSRGLVMLFIFGAAGYVFWRGGAMIELAMVGWVLLVAVFTPEIHEWDTVALVPLVAAPLLSNVKPDRQGQLLETKTALVVLYSIAFLGVTLSPRWIEIALDRVF
jgi:hypothetical protein